MRFYSHVERGYERPSGLSSQAVAVPSSPLRLERAAAVHGIDRILLLL
jgi:hypothetical protein